MPDVFTPQKRSEVMSRIKGRGNKDTELVMIQILRKNHISGWRRNQAVLGKPDFIFPKQKIALFVDGCFWHGCPKHSNMPKNNRKFWAKKLQQNKDRDKFVSRELKKMGWAVVRIWEHELKFPDKVAQEMKKQIEKSSSLSQEDYCYLTTTGRVTGKPHEIEIWFGMIGETIYLLSGGGETSDWVKMARPAAGQGADWETSIRGEGAI